MRDFEQDAFCYEDWRSDTMNDLTNRGLDVSEVNYCLDRLDELHDATVAAERERMVRVCTRIYNAGYEAGHHYTVEGGFFPIHPSDQDTYHEDVVKELLGEVNRDNNRDTLSRPLPTQDSEGEG